MVCSTIKALLLSKKQFGDGHLMLSVASKEKGFLKISAFGGQRLSKRFRGKIDYFQILELEIQSTLKDGIEYHNLSSANSIVYAFKNIPKDIKKFIAGSYVLELPSLVLTESEDFFALIFDYLNKIDAAHASLALNQIVIDYTLAVYRKSGFICNNLDIADNKLALNELRDLHGRLINKIPKTHSMLADIFI